MNIEIIKHRFDENEINSINARDLHRVLQVKDKFATWITRRIEKFQFEENIDFMVVSLVSQKSEIKKRGGDRRSKEYILTIDMAKELAMVENNEIGRNVRRYFIELEKKLSQTSQQPQPDQNIVNNIFALNNSIQILRPSEASKILMTEKLYKKLKLETCYLPKYTEEKLTRSLTYLLKKYEIKISTQKANLKLLELGILEKMERDSSCGKTKYFYSLTEKGLEFGKNLISPKNERETQPHFFEDKFLELVKLF
jgi:phage anti-repressor protein